MDAFSRMLGATIGSGLLSGFMVGGPKKAWLWVFHLFLADDTLLFCDVNLGHLQTLRAVLLYFKIVLGLKVNLTKSKIVPVGQV